MRRVFILLAAAAAAVPFVYATAHGSPSAVRATSLCHKVASANRPYVKISVSATQLKAHAKHAADIIPAPRGACPKTVLTPTSGGVATTAAMVGETENPTGDPVATGTASIRLRLGQGQACFTIDAKNLPSAALAAHIHRGAAGAVGAIVVPLKTPDANGKASACVAAARPVVKQILASPAQNYVNVHTSGFPGGAIRGQLGGGGAAAAGFIVSVDMSGAVERPAGDADGTGTAVVRIRNDNQLCYRLTVRNIILPAVGAHIHRGPSTATGPIVVPFTAPDATGTSSGCTTPDVALVNEIKSAPVNFYANVHTTDFPAGALRAQLG
jgi:CHRD domain